MTTQVTRTRIDAEQERAVLALCERYRLLTARTLVALKPDQYRQVEHAKRVINRLLRTGALSEGCLYRNQRYVYRSSPENNKGAFSETAKIRAYAMLVLCACRSRKRTRFTRAELQQCFPELCRPGLPMHYYLDRSPAKPVLGFVRVDAGGPGRWDRVVAKALHDAHAHWAEPSLQPLIHQGALEIRIVTALPQKAERIRRALEDQPNKVPLPMCISIIPELLNLIAPLPS